MKHIILMSLIVLASGCATKTIKVVDLHGNAVEGALVISQENPYIMQSWKIAAYITDINGEAKVVSNRGYIFKPGYYPVIDASELNDKYLWQAQSYFSNLTHIYPIIHKKTPVTTSVYMIGKPIKDELFNIPIQVCEGSQVKYNASNSLLIVKAKSLNLLPSDRFYFVGPSQNEKVSEVEKVNNLAFYCVEKNSVYKVGVSVSEKARYSGVPGHKLTIFTTKISSLDEYIEPAVKCMTETDIRIFGTYRKGQPDLYVSDNLNKRINDFIPSIPCSNKQSKELIEFVEGLL